VAFSFAELVKRLYENQGDHWLPRLLALGDAYQGIDFQFASGVATGCLFEANE
jgi:hypothetical protein